MTWIKCLTVKQPYAWAIIHGPKRVENRSKKTRFRGRLYIHAGKAKDMLFENHRLVDGTRVPVDQLAFGAIIGYVDVVDCVGRLAAPASPFNYGPWCWVLENPVALPNPIPWRGAMGIFGANVQTMPVEYLPPPKRMAQEELLCL